MAGRSRLPRRTRSPTDDRLDVNRITRDEASAGPRSCAQSDRHVSSKARTVGHTRTTSGQVFWLPDRPTDRAFPNLQDSVAIAAFVPGYSGGTATDSHRLPYSPEATRFGHPCRRGMLPPTVVFATVCFRANRIREAAHQIMARGPGLRCGSNQGPDIV